MRRPPSLNDFPKYPIVGGTIVLAVLISLGYWSGKLDISAISETVDIRRGQFWRFFSSTLPHVDIMHLVFNCYWTWAFGTLIEETFGHFKTLAIFAIFAVVANGAEYAFLDGGIGLSGVGYGLFGMLWVLSRRDKRFADVVDQQTILMFVAWFFLCIVLTFVGHPIANVAHGVGALAGAALGWAISSRALERALASAALMMLAAIAVVGSTIARPWINFSRDGGIAEGRLAYEALEAGQNQQALRWSLDATHMQPNGAGYWFNLGIAYQGLNRNAEAEAAYKRAYELEPTNAEYKAAAATPVGN
jgi:membrane associated rhomboid family serine protease